MNDWMPLIVAVIGSGGAGWFFKDVFVGLGKLRRGVSARETKRRIDIVQQRDEALEQAEVADAQRRKALELAAGYRLQIISLGGVPGENEAWAHVQRTRTTKEKNSGSE